MNRKAELRDCRFTLNTKRTITLAVAPIISQQVDMVAYVSSTTVADVGGAAEIVCDESPAEVPVSISLSQLSHRRAAVFVAPPQTRRF